MAKKGQMFPKKMGVFPKKNSACFPKELSASFFTKLGLVLDSLLEDSLAHEVEEFMHKLICTKNFQLWQH